MKRGEKFELICYDFLNARYSNSDTCFDRSDTTDSTRSDIEVFRNGFSQFFIEIKDHNAQSGQFVVVPENNRFVFSLKNHATFNEETQTILDVLNQNYEFFSCVGTKGAIINIEQKIAANWIIRHYKEMNVKYVMSKKNDFFICPIEKFAEYFDIITKIRVKKSGSCSSPKKYHNDIIEELHSHFGIADISINGKKIFVNSSNDMTNTKFALDDCFFMFSKVRNNTYEIRKLSKTTNMNVIFSIAAKREQDSDDLKKFVNDLS